jgi:crotonobetaine/carnitine-CoA ligase
MAKTWKLQWQKTLPQLLSEACLASPDKTYLDFSGESYSYAEIDRATNSVAHGLRARGVKFGDRVCALLENCSDQVVFWFAASKLGAVYVPLNTDLRGEFLRHQLADSGAAIAIVEARFLDRIQAIEDGVPELATVVCRGRPEIATKRIALVDIDELRSDCFDPIAGGPKPSDLALLVYTSGTTGPSKGCMISHSYATRFGSRMRDVTGTTSRDILWTPCPLFHVAALMAVVTNALVAKASASIYVRFSASRFWPEIERSRATAVLLVSTMLSIIPNEADTEVSKRCHGQLRLVWGAPLSRALIEQWQRRFGVKHVSMIGYSMTEAPTMIINKATNNKLPDGASGRRHGDFEVKIVDDDGNECPPNVAGEIMVRPNYPGIMFQGYWRRPEATIEATRDLWFRTGDIGKFDEAGYFYFVDRKKDYLRAGGENISSFELEAAFLAHPEVAEAAVHAVKSDLSEDEVKLTAVLKQGATITAEELVTWSLDKVPRFAVPRYVEFRSVLPRTPTNRVQKYLLRGEGVTAQTWDRRKSSVELRRR